MVNLIAKIFLINHLFGRHQAERAASKAERKAIEEQRLDSARTDEMLPWWSVAEFPDAETRIEQARLTSLRPPF